VNGPVGCVVAPAGNPERVTETVPANPFTPATEMEIVGDELPEVTLRCPCDIEGVKSATGGGGGGGALLPPPQPVHTAKEDRNTPEDNPAGQTGCVRLHSTPHKCEHC